MRGVGEERGGSCLVFETKSCNKSNAFFSVGVRFFGMVNFLRS